MNAPPKSSVAMSASGLAQFDAFSTSARPRSTPKTISAGAFLPVLDDAERARVGTLYKQNSFAAKRTGAALVARNIARHVETAFADKPAAWKPLVYCWRGGKRSGAMAHVLREIGWDARTLEGGYKSYRKHVVEELSELPQRFRFRVVHGVTGSGKSRFLRALRKAGTQVLDLEELAAHRGSVLGNPPRASAPRRRCSRACCSPS
jgi:tRNA 2-selenouridine synthase